MTLADMAVRILQQLTYARRTLSVDLSRYHDGVYVINIIKNDVQSDGVKVVKK